MKLPYIQSNVSLKSLRTFIFVSTALIQLAVSPVDLWSQEDSDPPLGAFLESNGVLVFDIESMDPPEPWAEETSVEGYLGEGYFRGTTADYFNTPEQGLLRFPIYIETGGRYQFQFRSKIGHGTSYTESNDSFVRLTDANDVVVSPVPNHNETTWPTTWYKAYMNRFNWSWHASNKDGDDSRSLSWQLSGGALYYFELSQRSKDHLVDRIALWDHARHDLASKVTGKDTDDAAFDALPLSERKVDKVGYSEFIEGYPSLVGADALAEADPDGDGVPNALEQWLLMDPSQKDSEKLPQGSVVQGWSSYRFTYDSAIEGSLLIYEISEDLKDWEPSDLLPDWVTSEGNLRHVDAEFDINASDSHLFHRLRVELSPAQ
ncbi:MAG: hypothetical protein AAGB46_13235 [Verrucomicrobiota bacterium]